jgi:hypothetical protein
MEFMPVPPIEIGTLTASAPDESQFIGSSSGVFFVNTVHQAFAKSKGGVSSSKNRPVEPPFSPTEAPIEDFIAGNDSPIRVEKSTPSINGIEAPERVNQALGEAPNQSCARDLIMAYFQTWHPLFPFLHGPTFLREVESSYANSTIFPKHSDRRQICLAITFQCVFNIAALGRCDLGLPNASQIESSEALLSLLGVVATKHDITALQTLLAIQLYFIGTMSLRAASTVGGILVRLLFHGGFHRCPHRYSQLSHHDRELRKRIFWSAYAMDRYLSQALGHPLGLQDSDIDVCVYGTPEIHQPSSQPCNPQFTSGGREDSRRRSNAASISQESKEPQNHNGTSRQNQLGDILGNYVTYCQITGRALELFHKSLHTRSVDQSSIVVLTSDVHGWWNNLPQHLQELSNSDDTISTYFTAFFHVLYQILVVLINRPFLSLNPSTPEFRLSLQTSVGASRKIILNLRDNSFAYSWPGILSGTWMAGLILAFACELELYPLAKGSA